MTEPARTTVVFTGSREWIDRTVPRAILSRLLPLRPRIAHGASRGFDRVIDSVARELGWPDEQIGRHIADWDGEGKIAGINRNLSMLRREQPTLVVGAPLPGAVGTWHCLAAADCPCLIFTDGCSRDIAYAQSAGESVEDWVDDHLRRSRSWWTSPKKYPSTPRHDRPWWVLVLPEEGGDAAALPLIEALLR